MKLVVLLALSYLLGAVPAGLMITKALTGVDVRAVGSGNIGSANAARAAGWGVGVLVALCDVAKGAVPVLAARAWGMPPAAAALAGLAAVAGHNWSVFLGGRGGKGVAATFGALLAFAGPVALILLGVWILFVALTRYSSVGSLAGLVLAPVLMAAIGQPREVTGFATAAAIMGIYQHRANLARLRAGTEHKITERFQRPDS